MRLSKKLVPIVSLCLSVGMAAIVSVIPTQHGTRTASAAWSGVSLEFLGRANSGSGLGGSEIAAYDAKTKRLFVTNGALNTIDFFDISNPVNLAILGVTGIQSVA